VLYEGVILSKYVIIQDIVRNLTDVARIQMPVFPMDVLEKSKLYVYCYSIRCLTERYIRCVPGC
jgi:hypothetical protein